MIPVGPTAWPNIAGDGTSATAPSNGGVRQAMSAAKFVAVNADRAGGNAVIPSMRE